jgi:hypothetical protein
VQTEVIPQLTELKVELERSDKPWYQRALAAVKYAPTLSGAFASMPLAIATGLTAVAEVLVNVADAQRRKRNAARSEMYFLLRLMERDN